MLSTPALRPALALLLAAPAFGLGADLTRTDGVLGSGIGFDMQGDPFEVYVLMPSFQATSIPLSAFGLPDPRAIGVGIDLLNVWQVGVLNASGQASLFFPLSADPTLSGLPLYGQFLTAPGVGSLVDELSNRTAVTLGLPGEVVFTAGNMPIGIYAHELTLLDDGTVAFSGGTSPGPAGTTLMYDVVHRFDPNDQSWTLEPGLMQDGRTTHTATKLADGRLLICGGANDVPAIFASCDIYDPLTGTISPAAPLSVPRAMHTATLLDDGRVLVVGGSASFDFTDPFGALGLIHKTSELYDPVTDSWSAGPSLPKAVVGHSAIKSGDGRVLVVGGIDVTPILFVLVPGITGDCHVFDPVAGTFSPTAAIPGDRAKPGLLTLPSGDVLAVGGVDGDLILQSYTVLGTTAIWSPSSETWTSKAPISEPRVWCDVIDAQGTIVTIGGLNTFDFTSLSGTPATGVETTTASVLSWTYGPQSLGQRYFSRAVPIDGGERVLYTGSDGGVFEVSSETYIP